MNTKRFSLCSFGNALMTALLLACAAALPVHAIQVPVETTYAANQSVDDDEWYLIEQRSRFLQAESALRKRDMARFRRLKDELTDYPLYPYLEFADITRRLGSAGSGEIETFIENYSDTPLAWRLRQTWLKLLARRGNWEKYLDVYEGTSDTSMRCQWLRALINADQADKAMPHVEKLWLVGRSQPPACDPVFKAWRSAGYLTRDLLWQRTELAIRSGRPSLASYLIRSLDAQEQPLAKEWLRVRKQPARVTQVARMHGDRETIEAILVYGIERLARRDPEAAAATWEQLRTRYAFSGSAVATLHRRIGLSFAFAQRVEALYWLNAIPEAEMDDRAKEWRIGKMMPIAFTRSWRAREATTAFLPRTESRVTINSSTAPWSTAITSCDCWRHNPGRCAPGNSTASGAP
jgi:soluble lytic murein transglycosylase